MLKHTTSRVAAGTSPLALSQENFGMVSGTVCDRQNLGGKSEGVNSRRKTRYPATRTAEQAKKNR
jgi:hypothetical protein